MGISLHTGLAGNMVGAHFPRTFRDRRRRVLETENLYLWEFCEENLEEGVTYWEH
jgi:hypothetical protein